MERQSNLRPMPRAEVLDDRELLVAYRGGDRSAADLLAKRTYGAVYAALFRLCSGNADLAADLTQETYRRAWQSLAGFKGRSQVATWLYRIAYTTFLNHVRRPQRLVSLDQETVPEPLEPGPSQQEQTESTDDSQRLQHAILQLSEDLRFTVTARFWGEFSIAEIADQEGITPVAIRKRLKKALSLLAEDLRETN
jgi:RNA polymerase sigma-70 factor (ECF subfamily)